MGNCAFCDNGLMVVSRVDRNGTVYKELVCARCHKENHNSSECYASRYYDGSLINTKQQCRYCNKYHQGTCSEYGCTLL